MKKVSIVTPSYNRLSYIKGCVESIRNQTYRNIEHIIVDGGSVDGTHEYLKEINEMYGVSFIYEKDKGMYDAINKGMRLATGEIVAYLNTDDRYFPWSIQSAVDQLNNGVDMIFGDLCIVRQSAGSSGWFLQVYKDFDLEHYVFYRTIAQPTVFFNRVVYEKNKDFGNGFDLIGDCDYWLRAYKNGVNIKKINEVLALQIDHDETLREKFHQKLKNEFDRLVELYGNGMTKPGAKKKKVLNSIQSRLYKTKFVSSLKNGGRDNEWVNFIGMLNDLAIDVSDVSALKVWMPGNSSVDQGFNVNYEKILKYTEKAY